MNTLNGWESDLFFCCIVILVCVAERDPASGLDFTTRRVLELNEGVIEW